MARWWSQTVVLALAVVSAHGQPAPAFEVASVKPADPAATGTTTHVSRGQVMMENLSLKDYIERAFDLKDFSLSAPAWLDSARLNIVAKPPAGTPPEQFGAMLQTLLADPVQAGIPPRKRRSCPPMRWWWTRRA